MKRLNAKRLVWGGQSSDVHWVATSAVPLEPLVSSGQFRLDLYVQFATTTVSVLPLRRRRYEILDILCEVANDAVHRLHLDADAAEALLLGDWPTNIHGLRQIVASTAGQLDVNEALSPTALGHIDPELASRLRMQRNAPVRPTAKVPTARENLRQRDSLECLLVQYTGNVASVARELRVTRAQVYRWMERLGIDLRFGRKRPKMRETSG